MELPLFGRCKEDAPPGHRFIASLVSSMRLVSIHHLVGERLAAIVCGRPIVVFILAGQLVGGTVASNFQSISTSVCVLCPLSF